MEKGHPPPSSASGTDTGSESFPSSGKDEAAGGRRREGPRPGPRPGLRPGLRPGPGPNAAAGPGSASGSASSRTRRAAVGGGDGRSRLRRLRRGGIPVGGRAIHTSTDGGPSGDQSLYCGVVMDVPYDNSYSRLVVVLPAVP